ncbi:hypothetical protein AB205_0162720, partial [Aquarana catesbeiana]
MASPPFLTTKLLISLLTFFLILSTDLASLLVVRATISDHTISMCGKDILSCQKSNLMSLTKSNIDLNPRSLPPTSNNNTSGALSRRANLLTSATVLPHSMPGTPNHLIHASCLENPSCLPSLLAFPLLAPQQTYEWPTIHTRHCCRPARKETQTRPPNTSITPNKSSTSNTYLNMPVLHLTGLENHYFFFLNSQ